MSNYSLYTDQELFVLLSEGDELAFEQVFNSYAPRLIPFAKRLTASDEVAKEIVQETFLRLWMGRDKLTAIEHPSAWIYTIASNQCYKFLRRKALEERTVLSSASVALQADTIGLQELKGHIQSAVGRLSDQRRKVFMLSRESGLTIPEIADRLQLSPNTVKNTLVSALRSIREDLESQGYLLPSLIILWVVENKIELSLVLNGC